MGPGPQMFMSLALRRGGGAADISADWSTSPGARDWVPSMFCHSVRLRRACTVIRTATDAPPPHPLASAGVIS